MEVRTFSYRFAREILEHPRYYQAYQELIQVCHECPLPIFEGKSRVQRDKDVVQQIMNTFFRLRFISLGWVEEPLATPDGNADALRADFRKTFYNTDMGEYLITLQIEVEFGNVASSYRNYFKFQLSFSYGLTDICVLIVPSQKLSTRIDSGVSNFEKTIREIPSAYLSVTVPILVIGLFDEGVIPWNLRSITEDINILRGASLSTREEHCRIVQSYIDTLV